MSGSITDSPWMRLLAKNYENRGEHRVDPLDDTFPELEKEEEELEREIQAEILAKLEQGQPENGKIAGGENGFDQDAGNKTFASASGIQTHKETSEKMPFTKGQQSPDDKDCGSITDSPWIRLMEKCYENRGNYPVDPTDDSNPALEKAERELIREIMAERNAKRKNKDI